MVEDVDETIRLAMGKYGAGDYAAARAACRKLTERGAARADVLNLLGAAELALGNYDSALLAFQRATQLDPADGSLRVNHAVAARRARKFDLALSILEQALRADPANLGAHHALGLLRQDLRQFAEAEVDYERARAAAPSSPELLAQLATVKMELGKWNEAVALGAQAAAMAPGLPVAVEAHASALLQAGNYGDAAAGYKRFLSLPKLPQASIQSAQEQLADAQLMGQLSAAIGAAPTRGAAEPSRDMIEAIESQLPEIDGGALTAVFFHVNAGNAHPYLESAGAAEAGIDYLSTVRLAATVLKASNPAARAILMTDETTDVTPLLPMADVVRIRLDASRLMHSRMRSSHALVCSGRVRTPVAFLDTDVCINGEAAGVFDSGFDVGLTYRLGPGTASMPINEGVILGAAGNAPPLRDFFARCLYLYDFMAGLDCMKARYRFDIRRWRGGQLALGAFVDWRVPPNAAVDRTIAGVRCRFLPCETYNYAVSDLDDPAALGEKWALHFKGAKAKSLMADFVARRPPRTSNKALK